MLAEASNLARRTGPAVMITPPIEGELLQLWILAVPALLAVRRVYAGGRGGHVDFRTVWLDDDVSTGGPAEVTEPRSADAILEEVGRFFGTAPETTFLISAAQSIERFRPG